MSKLKKIIQYCDDTDCRRQGLLSYLGEKSAPCGICDNCKTPQDLLDVSVTVQKILSTIYKVSSKFGVAHIIDILRGKASRNVQVWEHYKLSTFSLCSEFNEKELRRIIRQLYSKNIVDINFIDNSLKLTDKSLSILRGLESIALKAPLSKIKSDDADTTYMWLRTELEERIYQDVLAWRHRLAIAHRVSHHAVLSDRSIYDIVVNKPRDLVALANIYGIGEVKLKKYGKVLLGLIDKHDIANDVIEIVI